MNGDGHSKRNFEFEGEVLGTHEFKILEQINNDAQKNRMDFKISSILFALSV
jgi:hypothetical protein